MGVHKKAPAMRGFSESVHDEGSACDNAHIFALPGSSGFELYLTGSRGEQRMIAPQADIYAGMKACTTLPHDNITGQHMLAAEALHAQPF